VPSGVEVGAHRGEERRHDVALDPHGEGRAGEGVHHEVAAVAGAQRVAHVGLEPVEHGRAGGAAEGGVGVVHDLVGHPHEGVDVADLRAHRLGEQPGGQPERARVLADHHR
jgi:hypothetical protein